MSLSCMNNCKTPKSERWTAKECNLLFHLVNTITQKTGCTQVKMEDWKWVAKYIKGRSVTQCQSKWYRLKADMEEHEEGREPHQAFLSSEEQSQNKLKRAKLNMNEDSSLNRKFQCSTSSTVENRVVRRNATPSPDRNNQRPVTQNAASLHEERNQSKKRKDAMLFFELILNDYLKLTDSQQLQFKIDTMSLLKTLPNDM